MENTPSDKKHSLQSMLMSSLLFAEADGQAIDLAAQSLRIMEVKKGDPIVLEGEIGEDVFFIQTGAVEIVKYRHEMHDVSRVTILKPGTHFSEFSVLNRANKSTSAFALEDSVLYRMNGEAFLKIIEQVPSIGQRLVIRLADLIHNSVAGSSLEYFDPLSISYNAEIPKLLPQSQWKKFGVLPLNHFPGILLVAAKDPSKTTFFEHCKTAMPDIQINVVMISEHEFENAFKRLSHMYGDMSAPTKPVKPVEAEFVDAKTCLQRSPYFHGVAEGALEQLTALFESIEVQAGQPVFSLGDVSEYFYIVQTGRVELSRPTANQMGWTSSRIRNSSEGMAEVSLLLNLQHGQLARAIENSRILRMPKDTFIHLLSSGMFCINLAKILALRLQSYTDSLALKIYTGDKPAQLQELSKLIPRQLMSQHLVIPLRLEDKEITLGIVNPDNESIYSIISRYLRGYRIKIEFVSFENFQKWMIQSETVNGNSHAEVHGNGKPVPIRKSGDGTVTELNKLLIDGFEARASDLHLEPTGTGYCVRYRIDGVLTEVASKIPNEVGQSLLNRVKVMSSLDISNHLIPQDGQLKIHEDGVDLMARVATSPTKHGEGAVLRLIRNRSSAVPLMMLAPDSRTVKVLKYVARCKQGLFLVTGPTGCGKTTTLYSLIGELNRVDVKIISLEDPVELEIPGVSQMEINEKTGLTFERALKSTLRQDPDVLIVGEIRDAESAKSVFEAALSGHLVISTLHTNNSFAVKNRLKELGVPLGTMSAGLIGSMAQRLVRSICKKCRAPRPVQDFEKKLLLNKLHLEKLPEHLWAGKGCIVCNNTGYNGRLPIMEIWQKNHAIEELIAENGTAEAMLEASRVDGFETLFEFGLKMAVHGLTTIEEVDRTMAGGF